MTPDSTPASTAHTDAPSRRTGTLENPEVYVDVPGHVIPILKHEFDDFDTESAKFLKGETPEAEFIGFRLRQGVYGQRQPNVQMVRIKIPFGGVNPEQLEMFADAAERWAPLRKGHVTTRQCVQIHHVPLPNIAKLIREISAAGLSSREGCGNTVRNVTGDPWAGVCEDELFDPTPYAAAYVRYFVRHEVCQLMPRKFKTAFTATDEDRAITGIHDGGFIPRVREIDGEQVRGFEIRIGGGTSIMPRVALTLYEFVGADDGEYLKVTEAVLRIFNRCDELRKNRARARIKVLVDRIGMDAFREMVDEELQGEWVSQRSYDMDQLLFRHDERVGAPGIPERVESPHGDDPDYERFVGSSVRAQRQDGFSTVEVRIPRGDLSPEQFRGLAAIMREFSGGYARTTVQQNLVLRWVRDEAVYAVWRRLMALELGTAGAREINDVVSCPGTDSCKLGITSSMGLNRAIQDYVEQMDITDPLTRQIHIKISGCPNGCSQHHIANIGFYGASIKVGDKTIPAYIPHVGGQYEGGTVRMGARLKLRLPAKRVPEAVGRWIGFYESDRRADEVFNAFVDRVGAAAFEGVTGDLTLPVEFSADTLSVFVDWNRTDPFKVMRGEGECAV